MTDPKNGNGGFKAFAQHEDADKTAHDAAAAKDMNASTTAKPVTSTDSSAADAPEAKK